MNTCIPRKSLLRLSLIFWAAVALCPWAYTQQPPSISQDEYISRSPVKPGMAPGLRVTQLGNSPRAFQVVLAKGDEVASGMTDFARKYHLKASQVTAVGAFSSATLGWGDPEKKAFRKIPIDSEVEVILNGNITLRDGEPTFHGHVICVFPDGSTKGGHLIEARIGITMEAFVTEPDMGAAAAPEK
jgi:predicted DNA-binding protein with PD1-like motif